MTTSLWFLVLINPEKLSPLVSTPHAMSKKKTKIYSHFNG